MAYIQDIEVSWSDFKNLKAGSLTGNPVYYLKNDLQYVPFLVYSQGTPGDPVSIYFSNINRDPSSVSGPYAALSAGVKASAHIQDIVYTATSYGVSSITVSYVSDASAVGQEYVTVSGNNITVHIVSGSSTAQQVQAAVNGWNAYTGLSQYNSAASSYLVSAVIDAGQEGIPQTTQGPTSLTGGVATVTVLADWTTNYLGTATLATSFANATATELAA
jgi:hypothetical protein